MGRWDLYLKSFLAWIQWRFATMHDFLLENSIMYKELVREGELKGLKEGEQKGLKEGEQKGREAGIRESVEAVVQTRFPALLDLTRERLAHIQHPDALQQLLVAMVAAETERKARRYLLTLQGNKGV